MSNAVVTTILIVGCQSLFVVSAHMLSLLKWNKRKLVAVLLSVWLLSYAAINVLCVPVKLWQAITSLAVIWLVFDYSQSVTVCKRAQALRNDYINRKAK